MNQKPNNITKVIQFVDEGTKRRIDKGYYGSNSDWNPGNDITIYPISEKIVLETKGIFFNQYPNIHDPESSTFIQVSANQYSSIKKYPSSFITDKQKVLVLILHKLGIHEYFIKSEYKLDAGAGHKAKKESHKTNTEDTSNNSSSDHNTKHDIGLDLSMFKVEAEYDRCEGRQPTMEEWKEAKDLAITSDLYDDFADIIEMRKPSTNSLLCKLIYKKLGGKIDINMSIVSSLKVLNCFKKESNFLNNLDFNLSCKGHYETLIFYNFNPNESSVDYKKLVDKEIKRVIEN